MDKRLAKRHKRQVERAKQHMKLSEPDVRTPEQIKAAREASRAPASRGNVPNAPGAVTSFRGNRPPLTGGAVKTDG